MTQFSCLGLLITTGTYFQLSCTLGTKDQLTLVLLDPNPYTWMTLYWWISNFS